MMGKPVNCGMCSPAAVLILGLGILSTQLDSVSANYGSASEGGYKKPAVDGGWSEWSRYDECSAQCGGGSQKKTRTCTAPAPQYGGAGCVGPATSIHKCNAVPCPVNGGWSEWSRYDECSAQCGGGSQTRTRTCTAPAPMYQGVDCVGLAYLTIACNTAPCPVDGGWSEWSRYGECSAQCGGGSQKITRTCTAPAPQYKGAECVGLAYSSLACNTKYCPVDGGWSEWSRYDECSAQCGGGSQTKTRTCTSPTPAYQGADCVGLAYSTLECNKAPCPVNGGWSEWSRYDECSAKCGGGSQTKTRTCTAPAPDYNGASCQGKSQESEICNELVQCAVAGGWADWSSWSSCSKTCGHGTNMRTRTCSYPQPAHGGAECVGDRTEYRQCKHRNPCPMDGGWADWGEWTVCTGICGMGTKSRVRTCTAPVPMIGGEICQGKVLVRKHCTVTVGCGYI